MGKGAVCCFCSAFIERGKFWDHVQDKLSHWHDKWCIVTSNLRTTLPQCVLHRHIQLNNHIRFQNHIVTCNASWHPTKELLCHNVWCIVTSNLRITSNIRTTLPQRAMLRDIHLQNYSATTCDASSHPTKESHPTKKPHCHNVLCIVTSNLTITFNLRTTLPQRAMHRHIQL
jgi:hypothetical protein